jgi:hypothetical protein
VGKSVAGDGEPPRGRSRPVPGAWDGHGRVAVLAMQRRTPARTDQPRRCHQRRKLSGQFLGRRNRSELIRKLEKDVQGK